MASDAGGRVAGDAAGVLLPDDQHLGESERLLDAQSGSPHDYDQAS